MHYHLRQPCSGGSTGRNDGAASPVLGSAYRQMPLVIDPPALDRRPRARTARVVVVRTRPETFFPLAYERGLGVADPRDIELVGDDVSGENFGFQTRRSLVIWGDQMIRRGFLRPLERLLLHSPLMVWAPVASNVYHDVFWYPTIGRSRIRAFMGTGWGQLFRKY